MRTSRILCLAIMGLSIDWIAHEVHGQDTPAEPPAEGQSTASSQNVSAKAAGDTLSASQTEKPALTSSLSCGSANRGSLRKAAQMPRMGRGFKVPEPWWSRDHRYGTDELVDVITRAATTVDKRFPGGTIGVADLSAEKGGAIPGHRSHQNGRDADLIFYSLDVNGHPYPPDKHMAYYLYSGKARYAKAPKYERNIPERYFDLPRNLAFVKALVIDGEVEIEHIFVSRRIRRWLLQYAESTEEPEKLIKRAQRVLKKPQSTGGHNDHMHIRVRCAAEDIALGRCKDRIAKKKGRRKFYSRVRCPAKPRSPAPVK